MVPLLSAVKTTTALQAFFDAHHDEMNSNGTIESYMATFTTQFFLRQPYGMLTSGNLSFD